MHYEFSQRARTGFAVSGAAVVAALTLAFTPTAAFAEEPPVDGAPAVSTEATPTDSGTSAPAEESTAAAPEASTAEEPAPAPEASTAEEPAPAPEASTPGDAAPVEGTESVAPSESTAPAPDVVVADSGTTVEETLALSVVEPTVTLFEAEGDPVAAAAPVPGDPCYPAVCITNGTILLAVNPTGELNTDDATGSVAGPGDAGLEYVPTGYDSTSPGCLCEGWGVADPGSGVWGGANLDTEGVGGTNLVLESFEYTGSTATSVVLVVDETDAPVFRVTHEYVPSPATPNLYQVNVTIENVSGVAIATVQYRRVMDWDIEPTAFDEFVTIDGGSASALFHSSDDGFASPNPLSGPSSILFEGNAVDSGPDDHGALFDFAFGPLGIDGKISFVIFYGAAATEAEAKAALAAVGAEAYSFGQTSTDPAGGTPNTFIFAFGKVGGTPIFPPGGPVVVPPPAAPAAPAAAGEVHSVAEISSPALASTGTDGGAVLWLGLGVLVAGAAVVAASRLAARRSTNR